MLAEDDDAQFVFHAQTFNSRATLILDLLRLNEQAIYNMLVIVAAESTKYCLPIVMVLVVKS